MKVLYSECVCVCARSCTRAKVCLQDKVLKVRLLGQKVNLCNFIRHSQCPSTSIVTRCRQRVPVSSVIILAHGLGVHGIFLELCHIYDSS